MSNKLINIEDRNADYQEIDRLSSKAEKGIRAVCVMYDDHSSDKASHENIFVLKENVHYRLVSLVHQYVIYLRELNIAEAYLEKRHSENPNMLTSFFPVNPYFEKVELEISSIFDSIIFQVSSVFDYLSHLTCYICKTNKTKTVDWTKLAHNAYGTNNEFSGLEINHTIIRIDKEFAKHLYDYRSRLIHRKKDKHTFNANIRIVDKKFDLKIIASDTSIKHFQSIRNEYPEEQITLTFLASWIIKKTFTEVDAMLEALRSEILKNSNFNANIMKPKANNGFMIVTHDPKTNFMKPVSEGLWDEYKRSK